MTDMQWSVTKMECVPQEGQYTNVVIMVDWQCFGHAVSNGQDFFANIYGTARMSQPEGSFTPYDQLTQDQVLGWVWASGIDKEVTEADVQKRIDLQISPPVVSPPLPWAPPSA